MIFDLTAEILRDLYKEENEGEESPWDQFRPKKGWPIQERSPPTTLQALKPILENSVLKLLRLDETRTAAKKQPKFKAWGGRKKKDHLDQILVQELREEEPGWINYDDDEFAVKMQLADALFDSLLSETCQVLGNIQQKRLAHKR